ncbi:MAG: hypothetical protein UT19_C0005G0036 [Candidatus Woesebacteria bacterium GW2011_GWB1_39_10b]|uniref:Uncharacterized protein n=3 Tax=Candidatus Woeseibacteriota TaxID=1752722 RepID=A0A0G0RJK0_9BACT|nr:MAG: hypothetical protein US72_C0012G0077 [Microgenomates group bacterium GW2011_GWC1_38_12]KKQ94021.1 MAG: hypothetical protein UT19_C0005G0036 [Candidatus Woesebacteria bacterium GW2011_GWB1_39_10b]KKR13812.1 MAG: hypothetical protein UT40_C0010G0040 [Candidatus Woesebacteria bacterium GW2011_GWA1_39_21b]OGM65182.1 MAG: hypothetical protein A3A52_04790 [Candidatus Woesebacteria bacterium RIFCSPLOWO2_01_FULL_39_14]
MTKYKEYVAKMLEENKEVFESFRKLHDEYALNSDGLQDRFNMEGKKVLEIIHEYENRLCANTERGMYNKFSQGLAEKFQNEVRKIFPKIDYVGLITETSVATRIPNTEFIIKKIELISKLVK